MSEPNSSTRSEYEILESGAAWLRDGESVVLATVAHTWGSSPRPIGAVMVLTESGKFLGSVSGGCIEEELLQRVRQDFPRKFETIEYSSDTSRTLPCGGRLLLTLEVLDQVSDLAEMLDRLRAGERVVREINLLTGEGRIRATAERLRSSMSGEILRVVYESNWKLQVVGAGELASWVCRTAAMLGYDIAVCDPRPDYRSAWPLPEHHVDERYPDDFFTAFPADPRTAVVALTHDPKVDDLAVMAALESEAFYVGALGSRRTTKNRAERLQEHFGISSEALARVRGPIGIDLNTRHPQEIALSIMVDITAARNGVEITTRRLPNE